jgi:hypothetical protein
VKPCPFCKVLPETRPDYQTEKVNCKNPVCALFEVPILLSLWEARAGEDPLLSVAAELMAEGTTNPKLLNACRVALQCAEFLAGERRLGWDLAYVRTLLEDAISTASEEKGEAPILMVLHCPRCKVQHIDRPDPDIGWTNPLHRSHRCANCETVWRPASVYTEGVEAVPLGEKDTWPVPCKTCGGDRHDPECPFNPLYESIWPRSKEAPANGEEKIP